MANNTGIFTPPHRKSLTDSILTVLFSPFRKLLPLSSSLFLLGVLPYFFGHLFIGFLNYDIANYKFACLTVLMNFFIAWIAVLPLNISSKIFNKIWSALLLIIYIFISILDCGSIITVNLPFQQYLVDIIYETNPTEASEFIENFINFPFFAMLLTTWGISALAYYVIKRFKLRLSTSLSFIGVMCSLLGYAWIIRSPYSISLTPIYKIFILTSHHKSFDFRDYPTNPQVSIHSSLPKHLVIIIGESFQATHSNLYGYQKNTTPRLKELYDEGELFICQDVKSADLYTYAAIIKLLTFAKNIDNSQWMTEHRLPEILSSAGYHTTWISNQGTNGANTNIGEKFSQICDTAMFFSKYISSVSYHIYDDEVLKHLDNLQSSSQQPHAEFIQLMGSHFKYAERYPDNFVKFTSADYPDYTPLQARTLAEYDNSLAYNDSIIKEIIKHYTQAESMIIYLSDHGQDLFVSDSNYAGHARPQIPISETEGSKVPFIIYLSPKLRIQNPELTKRVDSITRQPIDLINFPEIVMDCLDISLE